MANRDSSNLSARASLHARFSTEESPWFHWVFDHFDIPENGRVLELGCGTGLLWRDNLGRIPPSWKITLSDASQGMVQEAELSLLHSDLQLTFEKIDVQSIPYRRGSFDAVIANHMVSAALDSVGAPVADDSANRLRSRKERDKP